MLEKAIFRRKFNELTGSIHNHSEYSYDSNGKVEMILNAAKKNKLDYLTFNDHHNLDIKNDPLIKKEKDIICILGFEINDPNSDNHYLVFNSDNIISGKSAEEYVSEYDK